MGQATKRMLVWGFINFFGASYAVAGPRPSITPKLVVLLVVDQMRADYVDTYGKNWKGGLDRLFSQGAHYRNAAYPYLQTITCAGHATIATGAYPYAHGMIQNAWFERATGRSVSCTDDKTQALVSYGDPVDGGDSAQRLLVPTLADEMRAQLSPAPRVVTYSLKARGAIMLAGHAGTSVAWTSAGSLVTSQAYRATPLPELAQHLKRFPVAWDKLPPWTLSMPRSAYLYEDDGVAEHAGQGWSPVFPHVLVGASTGASMSNWTRSPLADEYVARLGLETVRSLKLGQGTSTDFLGLSFSVLDFVGHGFGPRSFEVQDVLARLDQTLGRFFDGLDQSVGKNNYVVALSADHGVAPLPEQLVAEGKIAGRVSMTKLKNALLGALTEELGGQNNVASVVYTDLYLAPGAYERLLAKPGAIERVLKALKTVPGVADAFHAGQLKNLNKTQSGAQKAAALSFHAERSGDLVLVPAPNWMLADAGTTHGSTNDYDQRVPVVFMGAGIKKAKYERRVSPADIAPTLGQLVGVRLPKADGHALREIVKGR